MTIGRVAVQSGYFERLQRARLRIHSPQADIVIGDVIGKPDIALQIGLSVMDTVRSAQARRRPQRPVASVVADVLRSRFLVGGDGHVIFGKDGARRLSRGARAELEFHRRWTGPADPRQIRRQFFLVEVDDRRRLAFFPQIAAGHGDALHQIENRGPARGVKALLENVIGLMAAGTAIPEYARQAAIVGRAIGQGSQQLIARQLPLKILQVLQCEILVPSGRQIDFRAGRLEGVGLRPNFICPRRERRKIVVALLIGENARCDGPAFRFGGDGHSAHLFAGIRFDRARQQRSILVGSIGTR